MASPRILVLRAPGTNCDSETAYAFEKAGSRPDRVHINQLLERPALAKDYQVFCIPGGFSYGDDLGAGRILANQIRHHLAAALAEFKAQGKLVLGICNGFQVLIKSGVLLPDTSQGSLATLMWNDVGLFQDRWVKLTTAGSKCVFLQGIQEMYLPIAHAEGKFVAKDAATLESLTALGHLPLRYSNGNGSTSKPLPFPLNPNGSHGNVAGVCDDTGRVFGLMPHPERHIDATQHPQWTRQPLKERGDGLAVFENAVKFFQ